MPPVSFRSLRLPVTDSACCPASSAGFHARHRAGDGRDGKYSSVEGWTCLKAGKYWWPMEVQASMMLRSLVPKAIHKHRLSFRLVQPRSISSTAKSHRSISPRQLKVTFLGDPSQRRSHRSESRSRNLNLTVVKQRDRGVLFCALAIIAGMPPILHPFGDVAG